MPSNPDARPTVVLVHGAFADSSSWNGVIAQLRREGYPVIGVANPLRGLHGDAELGPALHQVPVTTADDKGGQAVTPTGCCPMIRARHGTLTTASAER